MNKYITQSFAAKLLLVGVVVWGISQAIAVVTLWNIFSAAGDFDTLGSNDALPIWETLANINVVISIGAYIIMGAGVAVFVWAQARKKKK